MSKEDHDAACRFIAGFHPPTPHHQLLMVIASCLLTLTYGWSKHDKGFGLKEKLFDEPPFPGDVHW